MQSLVKKSLAIIVGALLLAPAVMAEGMSGMSGMGGMSGMSGMGGMAGH